MLRAIGAGVLVLVLSGCAGFSQDGGLDAVSAMTSARTGQDVRLPQGSADSASIQAELDRLLGAPLSADGAVRVALLNNRGLRASLAGLGVAEADLVQAGRMANPGFSFSRMSGGGETEIERSVMFDLVGLLTIPIRRDIEARRFKGAQLLAATDAVRLAADTRKAWFNAVAAAQSAHYAEQVREAAQASAELARRMAKAGNLSALDQAREQVFSAETTARLARARHNATAAREQLARLMGVWGAQTAFTLPDPTEPKPYDKVITADAKTQNGLLRVHTLKNKLYFEIPKPLLEQPLLMVANATAVPSGQERLQEAAKHGFRRAIVPHANAPKHPIEGMEVVPVKKLADALEAL